MIVFTTFSHTTNTNANLLYEEGAEYDIAPLYMVSFHCFVTSAQAHSLGGGGYHARGERAESVCIDVIHRVAGHTYGVASVFEH